MCCAGPESAAIRLHSRTHTPLREVFDTLFGTYRLRTFVGLTLMAAQAFFYNAIFFTYALVLTNFYGVGSGDVGWYILPFALGNFLGPVVLGRLFDTLGRRLMIAPTYALSGLLLIVGRLRLPARSPVGGDPDHRLDGRLLRRLARRECGLSDGQRDFPIEIRALTIAIFYAIGTGLGGVAAPFVFSKLIESGSRQSVFAGYAFAALLMLVAAFVAGRFAVRAERKPLEQVAAPLSTAEQR